MMRIALEAVLLLILLSCGYATIVGLLARRESRLKGWEWQPDDSAFSRCCVVATLLSLVGLILILFPSAH